MPSAAQVCSGTLGFNLSINENLSFGALGANSAPAAGQINPLLTFGNGASGTATAINLHIEEATNSITLTPSSTVTLTLSSLTDDLGRNFSMAGGVRYLVLYVTARQAGDYLTITPGASHGWTGFLSGTTPSIKVFKLFLLAVDLTDVYAIAAGSNDQVTITNGGSHNITFQYGLGGCNS